MVDPSRRRFLCSVGVIVPFVGCVDRIRPPPSSELVVAYIHEAPTGAVVVQASDERIAGVEPIQAALHMAHEYIEDHRAAGNNPAELHDRAGIGGADPGRRYYEVRDALDQLPYYDGRAGGPGNYVEYRVRAYQLILDVLE